MFIHTRIRGWIRVALLAVGLVVIATPIGAAETVEVLLKGHDKPLEGYLRQVSDSRFLLQGENVYHAFPGNQIVTVDGRNEVPESVKGGGRLIFSSFYEKILPGGDVEAWSHNEVANESAIFLTGTDWGAAAWEEEQIRTLEVYDAFNQRLPVAIVPRGDGTFRVEVTFLVPVAPGESLGLSLKTIRKGAAKLDGDTWSYTFNVDFNEDRYLTRKIELPVGAEVVDHYLGCWKFEMELRPILISQRYYPAGTVDPLTVQYKLP